MKLKDLTEEQADKICDYIFNTYGIYSPEGICQNFEECCQKCPYAFSIDDSRWRECSKGFMYRTDDVPEEFEKVIKDEKDML